MLMAKSFSWRSLRNLHEYTKLLIHSNSTDGSTSFSDASDSGHAVNPINSAQHDTDQYKFAPTSILFNGSSYLSIDDHANFNLGSDPFTVDFWARFSSLTANRGFFRQAASGTSYVTFYWDSSSGLTFEAVDGASALKVQKAWSPSADTWYHLAVVRSGDVFTLYVDGRSIGSETVAFTLPNVAADFLIGQAYYGSVVFMWGWLDEFRLVKGNAMWTNNFVPPKGRYS
jgi:hypothetical protein